MNSQVEQIKEDVWIPTACEMCYSSCGVKAHRVNGVVVKIEGRPDYPHNWGRMCAKGNAAIMGLYDPNRIKTPLKRTNPEKGIGVDPKWVEIGWEEALDTIAGRLNKVRADNPDKLAVATFDLSNGVFTSAFTTAFGSSNQTWCSADYYCGAGLHMFTYLTNASFHMYVDLERCNYTILFGSQHGFGVGSSANITTQKMADARIRGMRLVVVDPVCSTAASKADEWLPIRPGTDGAMALAMLNVLMNEAGIYDTPFIKKHTNGPYLIGPDGLYVRDKDSQKPLVWESSSGTAKTYDAPDITDMAIEGTFSVQGKSCQPAFQKLKEHVKQYTPEEASKITTIPAETIRRIAREYGTAASVGATIMIEGESLPFRPAAVHQYRGAYSHTHSAHHALAIQLLNIVVGNIYVPGGHGGPNPVGPWWEPGEGIDGLLVAARTMQSKESPYRFLSTRPEPPKTPGLASLFPVTWQRNTLLQLSMTEPEKYGVQVPEVLIQCRTNWMMTTVAPELVAKALKNVSFIASVSKELDETVQFADIVLPDLHSLEKLDAVPNSFLHSMSPTSGYWYFGLRQPVVKPPFKVLHWVDLLIELADRVGFLEEFNLMTASMLLGRTRPKIERKRKYTYEEICDLWLKAVSGDETKGLDWFKEHGQLTYKRNVRERYSLPALKHRIPLYYEHFLKAKEWPEKAAKEMNISWDTSDYTPLPDWKPCPAFKPDGKYDLFVVNYTIPFHQYSITPENPWLSEISERNPYVHKIMVNTETARKRGIRDGATICVETIGGRKVTGKAKVTECIHPEVLGIGGVFGAWADGKPIAKGKGAHFNSLIPFDLEHIDKLSASADACERVRVYPI